MNTEAIAEVARTVLAPLDGQLDWLRECYVDLHRHPELSEHEVRTAGIAAGSLATSLSGALRFWCRKARTGRTSW